MSLSSWSETVTVAFKARFPFWFKGYPVKGQQKCLAHLRRHLQKLNKTKGKYNQIIAETFLDLINEAFKQHQVWRKTRNELQYRDWAIGFKQLHKEAVTEWIEKAGYDAGKLVRSLKDKADQWWYFLDHPDVPPDNNLAERCLRTAVIALRARQ